MAKVLNDDQPLSAYINDDDQTIHLLAKTQQADAPNPNPSAQPQGQPQGQGQPSQQNNLGGQQNRNAGQGVFFSTSGVPPGFDIGNILNGFLNPAGGGGGLGSLFGALGNLQNPGAPQQPNAQNQSTFSFLEAF